MNARPGVTAVACLVLAAVLLAVALHLHDPFYSLLAFWLAASARKYQRRRRILLTRHCGAVTTHPRESHA